MKKAIIFFLPVFIFIFIQSCRKTSSIPSDNLSLKKLTDSAVSFLLSQRTNSPFADTLYKSASWNKVTTVKDNVHNQTILYLPVTYNNNNTHLFFELDNIKGSVQDGYLAEIPSIYSSNSIDMFVGSIYNHDKNTLTAKISAYSFNNLFRWELSYKNGDFKSKKYIDTKSKVHTNKSTDINAVNGTVCTDYYLVTWYSDGSSDWTYLSTNCVSGCQLTKQIIRIAPYSILASSCPGGGSGGTTTTTSTTTNPNKIIAKPTWAIANVTKLPNGKLQISAINTGMFFLANITVTFVYDPTTKTIDPATVTSLITGGVVVGTWTQTSVTNYSSTQNDLFFSINNTISIPIPGVPAALVCPYTMNLDYNTISNVMYFDNVDHTPFQK